MRHGSKGFTLVELLIVIVIIAIIATIIIVTFRGVTTRALNSARLAELEHDAKLIEMYKAENGIYPDIPHVNGTEYCIGTGFPNGHCDGLTNSYVESNMTYTNALKTVGTVSNGNHNPVNGFAGPIIWVPNANTFELNGIFDESYHCPSNFSGSYDGSGNGYVDTANHFRYCWRTYTFP